MTMGNFWSYPHSCLSSSSFHPFPIETHFCCCMCRSDSVFGPGVACVCVCKACRAFVCETCNSLLVYYSNNGTIYSELEPHWVYGSWEFSFLHCTSLPKCFLQFPIQILHRGTLLALGCLTSAKCTALVVR